MTNKMIVRLMQVLGGFDTGFEEFEKHLNSPDCVATDRVKALFAYFEQHFGRYNTANLNPHKIFKATFPASSTYKSRKVSDLIRELTEVLDDFLPTFAARVDPELRKAIRRKLYHDNHEELLFYEQLENHDKEELEELGAKSALESMYRHHDFYYFIPEDKSEITLSQALENHLFLNEVHYEINRLKSSCTLLNRAAQYDYELPENFRKNLLDFLARLEGSQVYLVKILAFAAKFYLKPSVDGYLVFKKSFLGHLKDLPEDKFDLLHLLINGLSYINYPGGRLAQYFFLFHLGVEQNMLVKNKFIPARLYLNVISVAFHFGKDEWAKKFKESHLKLVGQNNEKFIEITEGYFEFGAGKYRQVITRLRKQHFRDIALSLKKYPLVLKSMYALKGEDEFHEIPLVIKGFKALLDRKKEKEINMVVYKRYLNYLNLLREMAKKAPSKLILLEKLKGFGKEIAEPNWLTEEIMKL